MNTQKNVAVDLYELHGGIAHAGGVITVFHYHPKGEHRDECVACKWWGADHEEWADDE